MQVSAAALNEDGVGSLLRLEILPAINAFQSQKTPDPLADQAAAEKHP
jgi:hypothetical protein